jgi:hypothetical protein
LANGLSREITPREWQITFARQHVTLRAATARIPLEPKLQLSAWR